ncbi:hypothetical protein AURDEDRAFT_165261 [Auricularia subglabra TFB-10046 SS5]|nr:hypothetical protein AURDEDRAFT_165261 [Auricularia subglabra TFB-10046 SS5]
MSDTVVTATAPTPAAPFIYMGGYPGVGKQTVARELLKIIPGSRLIDNHLLIDITRAVFRQGSPEYEALRSKLRNDMLEAIVKEEAARGTTFIFTGAHVATNPISVIARDFERAAAARGSPFVSAVLSCERSEHVQRLLDPPRATRKLYKEDVLVRIIESGPAFLFGCEHELQIDSTGMKPEEVAAKIVEYVKSI